MMQNNHIRFNSNAKFRRGFKAESERKAAHYRSVLELPKHAPLPARDLASLIDVSLKTPNEIPGLSMNALHTLLSKGTDNWSGATIPNGRGGYIVIYNSTESQARQESTLMHELAHIILGHEFSVIGKVNNLNIPLRDYDEIQEMEATWLGACLQLPRNLLLWCCKEKMSQQQIAEYANASKQMVQYRMNVSGVGNQIRYWR